MYQENPDEDAGVDGMDEDLDVDDMDDDLDVNDMDQDLDMTLFLPLPAYSCELFQALGANQNLISKRPKASQCKHQETQADQT